METLNLEQLIHIENEAALGGIVDPLDLPPLDDPKDTKVDEPDPTDDPTDDVPDDIKKDPVQNEPKGEDLTGFFSLFKEEGVLSLPDDFEFDGTPEGFKKALEQTAQNIRAEATKSLTDAIPQEFRQILAYVMAGGRDLDAVVNAFDPVDFDDEDLADPDVQKQILYQYYKTTTTMPDEKIASMVSKLEKLGNLKEEVEDAVEYMAKFRQEQQEKLVAEQEALKAQREKERQEFDSGVISALESSELPKDRKARVRNFMYSPITRGPQGTDTDFNRAIRSALTNPAHRVQLADMLMDYDPEKGFTFERFVSKGKSAANTEFRKKLDEALSPKERVSRTSPVKSDVSQIDWSKLLKQID